MVSSLVPLWIGGSTCSGKSTLARELADATGARLVSIDDYFDEHVDALPDSVAARVAATPTCERLARAAAAQADDVWAIAEERWPLIRRLVEWSPTPAVVEGEAILPMRLAELGVPREHAVFLVISPEERRRRYAERPWARELLAGCPDPDAAFEAWMARDDITEQRIRAEAANHGYQVFEVESDASRAAARTRALAALTRNGG